MTQVHLLKSEDLFPLDPMGESLCDPQSLPVKAWVNPDYALVLGASQKPELELNLDVVLADQIPIYKRKGGGGTVLLGPQGFCFGLRLIKNPKTTIHEYLAMGTGLLQKLLLEQLGLETTQRGSADLCVDQKKILGCSLYMPRNYVLYLASVLYGDESERIARYLAHPSREPEYRSGRRHGEFVTSLSAHLPQIPAQQWFCQSLVEKAVVQMRDVLDFPQEMLK